MAAALAVQERLPALFPLGFPEATAAQPGWAGWLPQVLPLFHHRPRILPPLARQFQPGATEALVKLMKVLQPALRVHTVQLVRPWLCCLLTTSAEVCSLATVCKAVCLAGWPDTI